MSHTDRMYQSVACPNCGAAIGADCVDGDCRKSICWQRKRLWYAQPVKVNYENDFQGLSTFNFKAKGYLASADCKRGEHGSCTGKSHPQKGLKATCSCKCHGSRRATAQTSIDTRYINFEKYPPRRSGKPKSEIEDGRR